MQRILLVEDDSSIVRSLTAFLAEEGFSAASAPGERRARELLCEESFDLLLVDISLADGSGFGVCAAAKERGLLTVQRFFLLDSQSVTMAAETAASVRPDMVEVMPGICPRVIRRLSSAEGRRLPVIAGGMIREKEDVMALLKAGVTSVSSTNPEIWFE